MKKNILIAAVIALILSSCNSSSKEETESTKKSYLKSFTEIVNGVSFDMIYVKSDTVLLGATFEQTDEAATDEYPEHFVSLNDYYIGKYEVTQDLWSAVMGGDAPTDYTLGRMPVTNVSWNDAQIFLQRLNTLTGKTYRLPTEAEWENAARGGKNSNHYKFSGCDSIKNVGCCKRFDGKLHPVGSRMPNELGIYDMSGNVWEWCQDWYGSYVNIKFNNPQGVEEGTQKVIKGGSYGNDDMYLRVSRRYKENPETKHMFLGFRLSL